MTKHIFIKHKVNPQAVPIVLNIINYFIKFILIKFDFY